MSPALARPLLHSAHLITFAVLLVSGLLLLLPGLRVAVTGGHSQLIRDVHRWGGVAFVALPLLVIAACGGRSLATAPAALSVRGLWQGGHMAATILMGIVFTLTGAALWAPRLVPEVFAELCRSTHEWLTYAAGVLLAAHLIEVGAAGVAARLRPAAADASV